MYISEDTIPAYKHFNSIHSFIHSSPHIFFSAVLAFLLFCLLLLFIMYYVIIIFVSSLIQLAARFALHF